MASETWTANQCAAAWGVKLSSWRAYVATDRAPKPLPGYDPDTGLRRWDPEAVKTWPRPGKAWRKNRPGPHQPSPTEETQT